MRTLIKILLLLGLLFAPSFAQAQSIVRPCTTVDNTVNGCPVVSPTMPLPIGGGFNATARAPDSSVTAVSSRVALGAMAQTARICNIGAVTAYVALGDATVVATTTGSTLVFANSCINMNVGTATNLAAITASSSTTLQTSLGTGIAALGGGGAGSGGGVIPGGSSGQIQYNNAGAFGGISGWTTDGANALTGAASTTLAIGGATIGSDALGVTGTATISGILRLTSAPAVSSSALLFTGAPQSGGTTTTNFPLEYYNTTGAAAVSSFSTGGTYIGVNAASGFAGRFIDLHVNGGASVFSITSGGSTTVGGTLDVSGNPINRIGSLNFGSGNDAIITRVAAASLIQGATDAAAPVAQTLGVQSVVTGTSNTAGQVWTINDSAGTGTGASGGIVFNVHPAGSTGSSQNAAVQAMRIGTNGTITVGRAFTVSSGTGNPALPAAGTAGRRAYVTDQTAACPATGGALTGGGSVVCPVFDNGSAWVGG